MFQSTDFVFDGKRGSDYGIFMVYVGDSGLVEQSFGIKRKSVTERIRNRHKSFSYGFETEVLEMNLKFSKETSWSYEDKVEFKRWFVQNTFKTFTCDDFPIEFDLAVVGEPVFNMDAAGKGYYDVQFESNSDCGYSPTSIEEFDLSSNTSEGTIINIYNKSNAPDLYYKPEIEITMVGDTDIHIYNKNDGNREFGFTNLTVLETVYVDSSAERIYSVLSETRYNNLVDHKFLRLCYGLNRLKVVGKCTLKFRMRFPMMV